MKNLVVALALIGTPIAALAQMPQPGTTAAGPPRSGVLTDAPVPSVSPPGVANDAPSSVPDRIAPEPGTSSAGPANSTPFSGGPAGLLPNNGEGSSALGGTNAGGASSSSPDVSR